ncbi:methyltransferase domain-containing protein [Pseudidiomarina salinarum]|uniref:methyltransferase domain-containing protein n=1 Tax=Pseudidiomarina salinarum TaxID=435908 RepID=UPI00068B34EF|nr:methyltransferase domain-containing protein [Pseudidiomarina salinarum]RUO70028.1 methyltransferase domain-containing protein [Pseudidiomarina salinarum]
MMLKPALGEKSVKAPHSWQQLPHGNWLRQHVEAVLTPHCGKLFGYHLARIGQLSGQLQLPKLHIKHQFSLASSGQVDVYAEPEYLPFAEASLDAVLMVAQLEFERDPHQVLREVARSLIADGYLLLAGFNPLCPALLTGFWPTQVDRYPWRGRYFTKARMLDWLALLNFEVVETGYLAPSLLIESLTPADRGLATLARGIPQLGSMYFMVARKRQFPLTLVRYRKKQQHRLNNALPLANRME